MKVLEERGDLGANFGKVAIGVLIGSHPKSKEMADALFGFKELLLVGFFLATRPRSRACCELLEHGSPRVERERQAWAEHRRSLAGSPDGK